MEEMKFEGSRAYEHVKVLSEQIGARVSGTPQEKEAADYVQQQFENLGLETQMLDFDVDQDEVVDFSLEILDPPLGSIHALPLVGTPDTPPEGLVGEIAFVETLKAPDVGPHLQGKIVFLVNGGLLGRDLQPLLKYEPLAVVLVGKTIGSEPNTFHVIMKETNRPLALVPTLHITYADGVCLWNEGASRARLKLKTERSEGKSYAVYAEVPGSEFPDEIIVIAGHMDSVPRDPGATDNAAGTATVLELARLYAVRGSRRTLRFAAWGSEEGGLVGSMRYVLSLKKKHKEEREAPDYVEGYSKTELEKHLLNINLDVLGMPLGNSSFNVVGPPALSSYLLALSNELGIHHRSHAGLYGSDHLSFANVGVPGVSFQREGAAGQYMHTSQDDLSLVDAGQLERVGQLVDVFITRTAAQGWNWPFERSIPKLPDDLDRQLRNRIHYAIDFLGEDPDLAN